MGASYVGGHSMRLHNTVEQKHAMLCCYDMIVTQDFDNAIKRLQHAPGTFLCCSTADLKSSSACCVFTRNANVDNSRLGAAAAASAASFSVSSVLPSVSCRGRQCYKLGTRQKVLIE